LLEGLLTYAKIVISSMAFVGAVYLIAFIVGLVSAASGYYLSDTSGVAVVAIVMVLSFISWSVMVIRWLCSLFALHEKIVEVEKELNTYETIE